MALADENSRLAYIALGANLGDPELTFACVVPRLQAFSTTPVIASRWLRSKPVNCPPGSPDFLNGVVALNPFPGETPETLLQKLQALEIEFGRQPKKEMNEARPLDLDLIAFGNQRRATPQITLPHPRAAERDFVLRPLAQIAPDFVLPGQEKNVVELLAKLDSGSVRT
jgi:2-amino-4-hydroxy-6-hydroxymethyldihydropteridine diphosphokinase